MITGIHISSSELVINKEDGLKNILPKFIKDQIISAKVLKTLPQSRAVLLVNGQKLIAKTGMMLNPGEDIQLRVLKEKDAVILKLIAPAQKITTKQISSLISFFSKNTSLPDITKSGITNVKNLLYDIALKSDKSDESFLPKLIEKSGILWEQKVARVLIGNDSLKDIKASIDVLLKQDIKGSILKELSFDNAREFKDFKMADSFLKAMENFQLLNHHSSQSGRFILPFPIFCESAFSFGQLLIDIGDKGKPDNKDPDNKLINISFMLSMTNLGLLRADFSILKKEITGRFLLEDDSICKYIKSKIHKLKERLANIDYQVHQIECRTNKKEEIEQACFIKSLVQEEDDRVLNIVI